MSRFCFLYLILLSTTCFAQVPDPTFSVRGGLYNKAFELELSCDEAGSVIKYTTDGQTPGSGSRTYTTPFTISKTHVIRARVFLNGKPGRVVTNSYFLERTYSIPVISIATDSANFWNWNTGIYVKGPNASPNYPFNGANYHRDWERRINVEFYETDNTQGFNQMAGTKIFGGWSRPLPQKSLALIARKKYGEKNFKHKIFPDKDLKKFKGLVLRNSGSDFNQSQFRDCFITSLMRGSNLEYQSYVPCAVYINGNYWGIQNLREKINEHYVENNNNANPDSVDMLKHRGGARVGNTKHYRKMLAYLQANSLSDQANFDYITTQMEVDNYALYNIVETFIDNHDAGGNIRFWRPQTKTGRWRWILFDTDFGFAISGKNAYKTNTLKMFTDPHGPAWPNPPWSTFIIRKLLENEGFKVMYINMWADELNTTFHPDVVNKRLNEVVEEYKTEMPFHKKRWGGKMENWETQVERMRDFGKYRPTYCRKHLMAHFNLSDTALLEVSVNDSAMGIVHLNSLTLKQFPFKGIYFHDNPIELRAKPRFDYDFVGWDGHDSKEMSIKISLKSDLKITAIFKKKANSAFAGTLLINEIGFSSKKEKDGGDWVELFNKGEKAIDLSGFMLKDSKESNHFVFPEGTNIGPKGYLVVAQLADSLKKILPDSIPIIGSFDFGLSSKKETLRLYDRGGLPVHRLSYKKPKDQVNFIGMELVHPDSLGTLPSHTGFTESTSPGTINPPYQAQLDKDSTEKSRNQWLMIGGGALVLLAGVFVVARMRKKKGKKKTEKEENLAASTA